MSGRPCSIARAMTLVEVMLALAILVVLSAGVTAFFVQVSARRDRLVTIAAQQRDAAVLFGVLEAAVMHAVAVGPDGSAGFVGDQTSLSVVTRRVSPMLAGDAALADASRVAFSFDERGGLCTLSWSAAGSREESVSEPILGDVERVRLRYSNGRSWTGSYDSASSGGLPIAVEVSVWFATDSREPDSALDPFGSAGPDDVGNTAGNDLPGPFDERDFGVFDEDEEWVPREPDHIRVIGVPDAPSWEEQGA